MAAADSLPAPGPPPAMARAEASATSLGDALGLTTSLDDFKKAGVQISDLQEKRGTKQKKMTHSLFFEDDRGLKKMLRTFPKIKFRGKGREYEDLCLLVSHYKRWFQELYPERQEMIEDIVWKARHVLDEKEKEDDGTISDPRERLHAFRFQYKNSKEEEEPAKGAPLSEEARARIEANRQKALEKKRQREAGQATEAAPEELDMDELWRMEEELAGGRPEQAPGGNDEEDPFGFGGGFDDFDDGGGGGGEVGSASTRPPPPAFEEEEDVFGFGFDMDDDGPPPAAKSAPAPAAAPPAAAGPAAAPSGGGGLDPEVARRIAEAKAKALARKAALTAATPARATIAPAPAESAEPAAATNAASSSTASAGPADAPRELSATSEAPRAAATSGAPLESVEAFDEEPVDEFFLQEPDDEFFSGGGFDDP